MHVPRLWSNRDFAVGEFTFKRSFIGPQLSHCIYSYLLGTRTVYGSQNSQVGLFPQCPSKQPQGLSIRLIGEQSSFIKGNTYFHSSLIVNNQHKNPATGLATTPFRCGWASWVQSMSMKTGASRWLERYSRRDCRSPTFALVAWLLHEATKLWNKVKRYRSCKLCYLDATAQNSRKLLFFPLKPGYINKI